MKKATKFKKEKNTSPPLHLPVETYFFYSKNNKARQKNDFLHFFDELNNLDACLKNNFIFLNLNAALQYSRFLQNNHVLLKAYVPHTAIQGHINGLGFKQGIINKTHIHGCFPNGPGDIFYLQNPYFDSKNLPVTLFANTKT